MNPHDPTVSGDEDTLYEETKEDDSAEKDNETEDENCNDEPDEHGEKALLLSDVQIDMEAFQVQKSFEYACILPLLAWDINSSGLK